ncbi:mitotic arrest deficient-domain-containing protein [Phanerochaete sordida]|uniref:Spindle assembly checkpoint component MAD1 n=1 Tax=Phanerochaete sordida TaxID=48140 RepID=A0A9P3LGT1_9APHY|nr:mitotic arrest deficient-domain-containing protein [Phanerochaete sordida]
MSSSRFTTPATSSSRLAASSLRSTTLKRDSLAAELERDPQLSTAKRKQRVQAFTSHAASATLERQLAAAQAAKAELETRLREKDTLVERLEADKRWLAEREKQEREEKERERAEREEEKRKADSDIRALRNSYVALREQNADLEDAHAALARSTTQTIATQRTEIATLQNQVEVLQQELSEYRKTADEQSHAYDDLHEQFEELSFAQANASHREVEDESWTVVREELHRQADHVRKIEAENAKMSSELTTLKQRHANIEVLKEQKRDLERKVRATEELREKVVKLEAELDAARKEREEWASMSAEPSKTPVSVTQSLTNLRLTYARLLEEHGSNVALLRQREAELKELQEDLEREQQTVQELRDELEVVKDKSARLEHRASLAERDVGFLKAMVASFTAEEASQDGIKVEEATQSRVEHLENLVADYRETISQMEKEIEDLGGDPSSLGGKRPRQELIDELEREKAAKAQAEQALREAEAENEKQLEQIDSLEQTLFELRGEIGAGRHLPPGVRVLSLRENPAQQWADLSQAAMDRLKGENEALLRRLKDLEESGVTSGAGQHEELVPRESWEVVNREKEELEQELKQKEKRLLRLKQVFAAKTDEFKEAIATILGVKLAFYPNGGVRVTSQFDLSAAFVFQPTKDNEGMRMQLVAQGDGGPEELPQMVRYWVEEQQCIPGFLASVTLECFEKHKRMVERQEAGM